MRPGRGRGRRTEGHAAGIIARLNRDINAGLADPAIRARLAEIGTIPMVLTASDFGALSRPNREMGQGGEVRRYQAGVI